MISRHQYEVRCDFWKHYAFCKPAAPIEVGRSAVTYKVNTTNGTDIFLKQLLNEEFIVICVEAFGGNSKEKEAALLPHKELFETLIPQVQFHTTYSLDEYWKDAWFFCSRNYIRRGGTGNRGIWDDMVDWLENHRLIYEQILCPTKTRLLHSEDVGGHSRIEIFAEETSDGRGIAMLYVYTDDNEPWSYTNSDEAYGHLCGYLQAKGLDEYSAHNIAVGQLRQALAIYQEKNRHGPFVLG